MKRFGSPQTAFASGWMLVRGARRRRGYERGFVLSDHADWSELVATVRESGAERVYITHGHGEPFAHYLSEELGLEAKPLQTLYQGEAEEP
jgi:putative mRNA 3-end processing factor